MSNGSIFTIKGFVADANVCGVPREVEFKDGTLHIRGLDIGEARELLRKLAPPGGETRYVDGDREHVEGSLTAAVAATAPPATKAPSAPDKAPAPKAAPTPAPKAAKADTPPPRAGMQALSQEEVAMEEQEADARAKTPELADTPPPDATKSETRAERRERLRKEREAQEAAERKAAAKAEAAKPADTGQLSQEPEAPDGDEADLESEDLAADVAAEGCKACKGTGKNSRGGPCRACQVREAQRSPADEGPEDDEPEEEPAGEGGGDEADTPLVEHGADALDARLVGASRLKHVLDFLMQHEGLEEEKDLIARCKELQEQVPALQRVGTNLDVRVKRTLAYVMKSR